ncbi:MAG TPA: tetratricopeptide repeat protein, partial [Abditibacteriaceae bacterium]
IGEIAIMPRSILDDKRSFDENRKRISHAALEYFTNRKRSLDAFTAQVNAREGTPLQLLAFCGLGGIGKTALLGKFVQELDNNSALFHGHKLPHARFDFKGTPVDASIPALLSLRIGLGKTRGITFPLFDPMIAMLIARSGAEAPPIVKVDQRLNILYQLTKGGAALTPVGAVVAGVIGVAETAGKWIGAKAAEQNETAHDLIRRAGGTQNDIKLFEQVQAGGPELQDELINRFCWDLKDSLDKAPLSRAGFACRAVILLDTYEQLSIGGSDKASSRASELEVWVRRLVANCLAIGVLPVIAGRDHLRQRWHEKESDENWLKAIDEHLLGGLTRRDAHYFLHAVGIGEAPPDDPNDTTIRDPLQRAIIDCCPEYKAEDAPAAPDTKDDAPKPQFPLPERGCHPLALALCAEIVMNSRADPKRLADPSPETFRHIPPGKELMELTDRFLNSLNDTHKERWLKELSLTPRFDEKAALAMAKDQNRTAWEVLTLYSFMEKQPDGFWRLHNLMGDCLRHRVPEDAARSVHEFFRDYWHERGEAALAFYHQWSLDPEGTLNAWLQQQEAARTDLNRIEEARQLLRLWDEIALDEADRHIGDELWARTHGTLANALQQTPQLGIGAALTAAIEHFQAALRVRKEDTLPQDWAMTQNNLGIAYRNLPSGDRAENLQSAIAYYQAALRVYKEDTLPQDWAMTQNNLGAAYSELPSGDRAENLQSAIACYQAALRVYKEDTFPQGWAETQFNLGLIEAALAQENQDLNALISACGCFVDARRGFEAVGLPEGAARANQMVTKIGAVLAELAAEQQKAQDEGAEVSNST